MEQQHLLQKYIWDIEFNSTEEKAKEVQERITNFIKESLVRLTDEVFTDLSDEKYDIRINKLEIDLGEVNLADLEHEIYWKLKSKLQDELKLRLVKQYIPHDESRPEFVSRQESKLSFFSHFLQYGYFPWSVKKIEGKVSVRQLFRELMQEEPEKIKKLLASVIKSPEVQLRLIRQLEDTDLWLIIKIWAESEEPVYRKIYSDIIKVYLARPVLKNTLTEYRELIWKFYLEEVVVKKHIIKDTKELITSAISYIAEATSTPEEEVIAAKLITVIGNASTLSFQSILPKVISELAAEKQIPVYRMEPASKRQIIEELRKTSADKIKVFIETALPVYYGVIREFIKEASAVVKKMGITLSEAEVETRVWNAAIKFLSQSEVKAFSKADFIAALIARIIPDLSVSVITFIQSLSFPESEKEVLVHKILKEEIVLEEAAEKEDDDEKEKKGFEEYRRKEQVKKEKFLTDLLKFAVWVKREEELGLLIARAENYIKELVISNPVLLKRIFSSSGFDLARLPFQRFIELLSPEVATIVLKEIAGINEDERIKLKEEAYKSIIEYVLQTGTVPYLELSKIDKKSLDQIVTDFAKKYPSEFYQLIDKHVRITGEKEKLNSIKSIVSTPVFTQYFSEIEETLTFVEKPETVREAGLKYSTDYISVIRKYVIGDDAIAEVDIEQVVKAFINEYTAQAKLFFAKITEKELSRLQKGLSPALFEVIQRDRKKILKDIEPVVDKPKGLPDNPFEVEEPKSYVKLESGEPIYINNAGMVIFHPYLTRFFKMLNLVDKKEFKDEYSAHKAAHLLQYLVNKGLQSEEHELVLNKIMCGIDINTPVFRDIELTEEDKATCESLIEGVIQNWPILKNTSSENFRASFLIREGRLMDDPKGWMLKVEERGYDVLVEKLPWAIGMVKLPWMSKIVYVEWK
ncbi:MAG TPA: contractile injection system tape measure protein [Cytophagaceae bacterium]